MLLARLPFVRRQLRGIDIQQIGPRREHPPRRLHQVHQRIALLIERRFKRHGPIPQQIAALRHLLAPIPIGLLQGAHRQTVKAQVHASEIEVSNGDLRRESGVISRREIRSQQAIIRFERRGPEADRRSSGDGIAIGVSNAVTDNHSVIGRSLRPEVEGKGVVPLREIRVDLRRRKWRCYREIRHDRLGINPRVEDNLEGAVRRNTALAINGIGRDDAG
ncbi:MAG: hypothetical protein BWY63_03343 [Chloroflexi bacterium ADurb.Bin360]|nr:MAG: hypothetical protein BWY63_03343 [Chloroflexi bacterium ADurb.Bin360]